MNVQSGYCSWLRCYCLWLRYLTRSSLELYHFVCNGQNYHHQWAKDILCAHILAEQVLVGRTYGLVSRVLVLVEQSLPLVGLFDQIFTSTIETPMEWPESSQSLDSRHKMFTPALSRRYQEEHKRAIRVLSLVALLLPLVALFDQVFTRTIAFHM